MEAGLLLGSEEPGGTGRPHRRFFLLVAGAVCLLALGAALGGLAGFRLGTQQNVGTTELPNAGLETDSTVEATTLTSAAAVSTTESVTTSTT